MTPYQFYMVSKFPELGPGGSISNTVQLTLTGVPEQVETRIRGVGGKPIGEFERLEIETGVRHEVFGYTNFIIDGRMVRQEFDEYVRPVKFPAYLDRNRGALFMRASHRIANGFLSNIRSGGTGVELIDVEIDFARVSELYPRCLGAWFKNPSPRVKSAGLSGDQIQNDTIFKNLQKLGRMSSLSMEFPYDHVYHPIILGKRGAVVLVKDYKKVKTWEPVLVAGIFEGLVSKAWAERGTKAERYTPPTIIDPDYDG